MRSMRIWTFLGHQENKLIMKNLIFLLAILFAATIIAYANVLVYEILKNG